MLVFLLVAVLIYVPAQTNTSTMLGAYKVSKINKFCVKEFIFDHKSGF